MKKWGPIFILSVLLSSCGGLRISPRACKSDGLWSGPVEGKDILEQQLSESYIVLTMDHEVRLKELLAKKGIDCKMLKTLRVEIRSEFFLKRKLTVYFQK